MVCIGTVITIHHHWAAVVSRGWAKVSACSRQDSLSCAVLCQIVSLQYWSRSFLHRLDGLACRLLMSYGLHMVTCEVHRSSLRRLMCPHFSHITDYIYDDTVYSTIRPTTSYSVLGRLFNGDIVGIHAPRYWTILTTSRILSSIRVMKENLACSVLIILTFVFSMS